MAEPYLQKRSFNSALNKSCTKAALKLHNKFGILRSFYVTGLKLRLSFPKAALKPAFLQLCVKAAVLQLNTAGSCKTLTKLKKQS